MIRRPSETGFPRDILIAAVAMVVAFAVVAVSEFAPPPTPAAPPPLETFNTTFVVGPAGPNLTPRLFGLSAQAAALATPWLQDLVRAGPFSQFRWGPLDDYTDLRAGVVYSDNGVTLPVGSDNIVGFVAFCRSLSCHAVLSVPGEIDDTVLAVETVLYVEHVLGFHPDYWSIGNEPRGWIHYGIPWFQWRSTDRSMVTADGYAHEVQRYIAAIRTVDPSARFIGIQSSGQGSDVAKNWIGPVAALNGPNLSAVAYHPYPGGNGFVGATVSDFFASLSNASDFPNSYPDSQAAVDAACRCHIPLWAGEYNAASGGNFTPFMIGYPEVPYLAAGLVLAMQRGVPEVTYFTLQSSALNSSGYGLIYTNVPRPSYYLYATILANLTIGSVHNVTFLQAPPQVVGVEVRNGTRLSLLIADANPYDGISFDLADAGFGALPGTAWSFDPSMSHPTVTVFNGSLPDRWTVPPEGVLLLNVG